MNGHSLVLCALCVMTGLVACGSPSSQTHPAAPPVETPLTNPYPHFHGGDLNAEKNFATLINSYAEAKIEPTPWAGYWWPYTGNGIASGSYGGGQSPAGKYDAARGGRTQAQAWEVTNHGARVKGVQGWWGHCNGWCAASALFPEPTETMTVNGVSFTVADQKALLTEAGMSTSADFFGTRVDYASDYDSPKYNDTVPDQYFLVLTNFIGKLHQAVLIDRYTGEQVWNQPLAGYRFDYPTRADYLGADPQAPHVYRIMLTSTLWWMRDDVTPGTITPPFTYEENDFVQSRILKMELWLDGPVEFGPDGKIQSSGDVVVTRKGDFFVGGAWRMGEGYFAEAWPDYMWVPYSIIKAQAPEENPESQDDYVNPHIDIDWLKKYLLTGTDDPQAQPHPVEPAPLPCPTPSAHPSNQPSSLPTPTFTPTFTPTHTPTFTPTFTPTHTPTPTPFPTVNPTPTPQPTFTLFPPPSPRPRDGISLDN